VPVTTNGVVPMRRTLTALVLAALVLGCSASDSEEATSTTVAVEDGGDAGLAGELEAAAREAPEAFEGESAAEGGDSAPEGGNPAVEEAAGDEASADQAPPGLPVVDPAVGDRVIKEGTVSVEVEAGTFDEAYAEVVEEARRLGGTVVSSTTTTSDDGGTSGSVTVRVPVDRYEDLLVGVGGIGQVRSREITAQDVSTEFVDLQSRQRNLEAQERFYLGLLEQAAGVQDAIAVQQQLDGITEQLEQIKGRIAYLDERTSYSTLTAQLFEPGGAVALAEDGAGPDLGRFATLARDAFVNVLGSALVVAGFLGPFALLGLLVLLVLRLLPRRSAPAAPALPPPPVRPEAEREREPVG